MIISVISPHTHNSGNTVSSMFLAHALADTKRNTFFTHIKPQSQAFETYLGLADYEDKTTTPTQLVKLMREGAIKPEDIGDYCKNDVDFLDIFTNNKANFSADDMRTLIDFIVSAPDSGYEYLLFDIDAPIEDRTTELVLKKSDVIILNVNSSLYGLQQFKEMQEKLLKLFTNKKIILLVSQYDAKSMKLKDVAKHLNMKTSPHAIRYNSWVHWSCNRGKLSYMYAQGRAKDADVISVYKDAFSLATAVAKTKVAVNKQKQAQRALPLVKEVSKDPSSKTTEKE